MYIASKCFMFISTFGVLFVQVPLTWVEKAVYVPWHPKQNEKVGDEVPLPGQDTILYFSRGTDNSFTKEV